MEFSRLPTGRYKSECPACGSNAVWTGKVTDDAGFVLLEMACTSCNNTFDERNPDWQADFTQ